MIDTPIDIKQNNNYNWPWKNDGSNKKWPSVGL